MSCIQCRRALPLNKCPDTLVVGTVAQTTQVLGYIKKISNGATKFFSVTSDGAGLVSVNVIPWHNFLNTVKTEFEIWLTLTSAPTENDRLPFTIDGVSVKCVLMRFEDSCEQIVDSEETLELE